MKDTTIYSKEEDIRYILKEFFNSLELINIKYVMISTNAYSSVKTIEVEFIDKL